MRKVTAKLSSLTPYVQCRPILEPRLRTETSDQHDERIWRQRCHVDENGIVYIPPSAFRKALIQAASFRPEKIPGRGTATYSKNIKAAVVVTNTPSLGIHVDDVQCHALFVDVNGAPGGKVGKRVWRRFPLIEKWTTTVEFLIIDDSIPAELIRTYLRDVGNFIGIGSFRISNGGANNGRFRVDSFEVEELED